MSHVDSRPDIDALTDEQITTVRLRDRRSFLRNIGTGLLSAAAVVASAQSSRASDNKNDSDSNRTGDAKGRDSDSKDRGSDNDQTRSGDYKHSTDRD